MYNHSTYIKIKIKKNKLATQPAFIILVGRKAVKNTQDNQDVVIAAIKLATDTRSTLVYFKTNAKTRQIILIITMPAKAIVRNLDKSVY